MCWSYEVSFTFSLLFLITNCYYLIKRPKYWKEYLMFGMFYFVMEAFQTIQWLYGNVYNQNGYLLTQTNLPFNLTNTFNFAHNWFSSFYNTSLLITPINSSFIQPLSNFNSSLSWSQNILLSTQPLQYNIVFAINRVINYFYGNALQGINGCDITNTYFTIFAHVLIWLQPIMFSYIGYRTSKHKYFFNWFMLVNTAILIYSLFALYQGYYYHNYYKIDNSVFGLSTCTNTGPTGHLVWRYKPRSIEYFPNYLMYMIMCFICFIMYDDNRTKIIGIGWFVSLVFTKLILKPDLIEMSSSWCLLSIFGNFIIISYLQFTQ